VRGWCNPDTRKIPSFQKVSVQMTLVSILR